jgi:hypothetical protein
MLFSKNKKNNSKRSNSKSRLGTNRPHPMCKTLLPLGLEQLL